MPETIVITGANRGIGFELARQAAARGDRVHALCRDPARMPSGSGAARVLQCDVTDEVSLRAAAAEVPGPVDILVCNAGQLHGRAGLDDPGYGPGGWQETLMVNVAGPFLTVRAFHGRLGGRRPRIAIIASVMGSSEHASGDTYSYRASKAGAVNLARCLADGLGGEGIAVGAYHPGWVQTDMGGRSAAITPAESAAGLLERFEALTMDRSGTFEDWQGETIPF